MFCLTNIRKFNRGGVQKFIARYCSTSSNSSTYNHLRLGDDKKSEAAKKTISEFNPQIVQEVQAAIKSHPIVVVGMAQNPFVRKLRKLLDENKIQFKYLEYGSYFSMWKQRLAIKLWSGFPTFPQVFVNGTLIGGMTATATELENGTLQKRLNTNKEQAR